ncbi:hypothetical protein, partial [Geminocystis sp. GBBB08]|uniref:hypothetical protein n=1 Tax=Geminocystis sp. GBBB08 TaxID=2604140 RepID=UPI0027E34038
MVNGVYKRSTSSGEGLEAHHWKQFAYLNPDTAEPILVIDTRPMSNLIQGINQGVNPKQIKGVLNSNKNIYALQVDELQYLKIEIDDNYGGGKNNLSLIQLQDLVENGLARVYIDGEFKDLDGMVKSYKNILTALPSGINFKQDSLGDYKVDLGSSDYFKLVYDQQGEIDFKNSPATVSG